MANLLAKFSFMEEWKSYKMGDLFTLEYGKPVEDKDSIDGPIPVFGTNGQIGTSHMAPLCNHPSVILGRKGAYRGVHFSDRPFSVIDTAFYVEPISDVFDIKWLYYKLLTYDINSMDSGSAIPSTDRYQIYSLSIDLPSLEVQKRTVRVLDSINDKIALNNRINHNLEEQAQALYKSWFVDFEPFKDGEFVDSELGLIPEGWRVGIIGDIATITSGKRPNTKFETSSAEHAIPVFGASSVMAFTDSVYLTERAIITGRVGTLGVLQRVDEPCWPSDNTLIIKSPYENFVFHVLKEVDFGSLNRGSTQPLLTQSDLKSWSIIIPPEGIITEYESLMRKTYDLIAGHYMQNQRLSLIRDALLPQLMSGQLTC